MEGKDSHANGNLLAKVNEESEKKRHCEPFELSLVPHKGSSDGPFMMPLLLVPIGEEANPKVSIVLSGTARRGRTGPAVGAVDIGVSKYAYFFRVSLPGVRKDPGLFLSFP
ncbi:hypothetical protein Acr_21g0011570 [Actinidia rufa]|uniref:HSP20-like chaperones superfamily protein n=1 Tax=Actinidia rufa TaxID=165716 RepID=A0A7J0GII9_9ERIC|nr:hypothetical protein Acr_21g0011570 [Actinidia rufa]